MSVTASRAGDSQRLASKHLMHSVLRTDRSSPNQNPIAFMTADVSDVVASDEKRAQSSAMAPILLSRELNKTHGDSISIDLIHEARELPTMGDDNIEGKEEGLERSQFSMRIDQMRKAIYEGSRLSQQRRGYQLRPLARAALVRYFERFMKELCWYQMMGQRGTYKGRDTLFPAVEPVFASDGTPGDEIAKRYINPLLPTTFGRTFFAGDAESIDGSTGDAIVSTDRLSMQTISDWVTQMETTAYPIQAINLSSIAPVAMEPFHLCLVTPQQWSDMKDQAGANWGLYLSAAKARVPGWNHPLFTNDAVMIDNVLVRKYYTPIQYKAGESVRICDDTKQGAVGLQVVPAGVPAVHQALFVGAQCLGMALASDTSGPEVFKIQTEPFDMGDKHRSALRWMGGLKAITVHDPDGWRYDMGRAALWTAVSRVTV